ncbi:uncharacterized protein LOC114732451 [Neltuma alba]|uniref:uncharacterized protein LOC114732451 n=1 Tax=Neltuma alba TaxID=207710 RepID=UPI0010A403BF|nr:uncharacterized protein LOC114732451 [Prosopis alba]
MESDSSPSPLQRSHSARLGSFCLVNPSKPLESPLNTFFVFFFLCNFCSVVSTFSDSNFESTYTRHCDQIVPIAALQPQTGGVPRIAKLLRFRYGYFSGGDRLFNKTSHSAGKHTWFVVQSVHETGKDGVYEVQGKLRLWNREMQPVQNHFRRLPGQAYRHPRITHWRAGIDFVLHGLWSESSGKLCMIGTESHGNGKVINVILKLNYPLVSSIFSSFINGTLESIDDQTSLFHFEPISIIALSQTSNYEYSIGGKDNDIGCLAEADGESLPLNNFSQGACTVFNKRTDLFELKYESNCQGDDCNPLGANAGYLPEFMYFYGIRCAERQKVQMLLGFPDPSYQDSVFPFNPNSTLVSEGTWDGKKNRLCAVACRILNFSESFTNAYVGHCSIKLTLRFPSVLSLRNRSAILGQIWSTKAVDESGQLSKIEFLSSSKIQRLPVSFQYKYTEIGTVRKSCAEDMTATGKGRMHPDGNSSDMKFSMSVRNSKGQVAQGYSSPLFVSDQIYDSKFYGGSLMLTRDSPKVHMAQLVNHSSVLNISYTISFKPSANFKFDSEGALAREVVIFAEGIYNSNTGLLCMVGCRNLRSTNKRTLKNESLDCELLINVQFPPLNAKVNEYIKGTVGSKRDKSDPYYFEPLQLSSFSIYNNQVEASIWRMDLEIILLLISNTLACLFVGLQLRYMKKYPDVPPYISIVMLILLTLGHLIPLLLNFEALIMGSHKQNVFPGSGGWLEVNEVVVRVVTMVAFLLELRLLQLAWSSRKGERSQPGCWVSEKKVLFVTLPLYLVGVLTAWSVNRWKNSQLKKYRPFRLSRHRSRGQPSFRPPSLWEDLKSLAGLLLDGFLLPQILFNVFFNSDGKALSSSFYVGTTIVRILPHAYDLYRAHSSAWYLDLSYIYANHRMDLFSTAWDIIIPCCGLSFSFLIYLQQKFGGRCILPKRFRESSSYEKVPVIGNNDL